MTSQRRPRVWADLKIDDNMSAGGSHLENLLLNAPVDWQSKTAIRHIARLRVIPTVVANASVSAQLVSIGIGVIARDAFVAASGAVTASIPNPSVATDFPINGWIFREQAILVNQQDSGTVEAWEMPEFHYDIRAARKVDRGILFVALVNEDLIAGTTAVKVAGMMRTLVLT